MCVVVMFGVMVVIVMEVAAKVADLLNPSAGWVAQSGRASCGCRVSFYCCCLRH